MSDVRRGRRPIAPELARTERLYFRATAGEADHILRLALRAGQSVSEYVRERLGLGIPVTKESDAA